MLSAAFFNVVLIALMLSVIILSVVMVNVIAFLPTDLINGPFVVDRKETFGAVNFVRMTFLLISLG